MVAARSISAGGSSGKTPAEAALEWRSFWMLVALAVAFASKLLPFGELTWLARGYGYNVALPVLGYLLLRPRFPRVTCALLTVAGAGGLELAQLGGGSGGLFGPLQGRFDPWDFPAYGVGLFLALLVDLGSPRSPAAAAAGSDTVLTSGDGGAVCG